MRNLIMLAGAAAIAAVMPAMADADAQGRGKGPSVRAQGGAHVAQGKARGRADARVRGPARARVRDDHWIRVDGRWVRASEHGRTVHPHGCPPGLADRDPPCVPPGQARRMFREGQRIPAGYRYFVDYDDIPAAHRTRVPEGYRYIYRDDTVYVVDPATSLVRTIIDLID